MGITNEIEELIAKKRGVLEDALAVAVEARDVANREIKRLREELDAAPRLHVKRQRKILTFTAVLTPEGEKLLPDSKAPVADLELTSAGKINVRPALPGALEMFPHGIERKEQGNAE